MSGSLARTTGSPRSTNLVDVLDRVLDKGLVVAGDVRISLADVELLTIRIRLLVCSIDKAEEIGLDWWRHDPGFGGAAGRLQAEKEALEARVRLLEERLAATEAASGSAGSSARAGKATTRRRRDAR